jgi:phosphatidate cytidylyltransferase
MVSLAALRSIENGLNLTLLMLLMVWATDIGAYFAGRTIGGPKILPKISPKKTWAGLFGGMISSAITGLLFALFMDSESTLLLAILGVAIAIVAQTGDFFESWVKRKFDVKDSGDIIPGHGGILDRIDGIMTAAPIMLIAAILYGNIL